MQDTGALVNQKIFKLSLSMLGKPTMLVAEHLAIFDLQDGVLRAWGVTMKLAERYI